MTNAQIMGNSTTLPGPTLNEADPMASAMAMIISTKKYSFEKRNTSLSLVVIALVAVPLLRLFILSPTCRMLCRYQST